MSNIRTRIGNVVRNFAEDAGWTMAGDVATLPEISFGLEAWAVGKVGISVGSTLHYQLEVTNSASPSAGQIPFEGKYLPNWPRMYRLDCHSVQVSGGVGASLFPETPISVNTKWELWSKAWGTPVLRHRANGAPPARDNRMNYVAGDPTGFLGLAMGGSVGGSLLHNFGLTTLGGDVKFFQFGSNFIQFCRDISNRDWRNAISRGLSMLVARNHLQFHFSGILAGVSGNAVLGTSSATYMAAEAELSIAAIWISRLHLFIHHPQDDEDTWRYVYTRRFEPNLGVSQPYKVNYKAKNVGRWDQAWAR
jgi:hypothetical protein